MRDEQIREIIKRFIFLIPLLLFVSLFIFWFARVVPGDPALIRAGPNATPETVEMIRHELGLDQPILVQYKDYMWGLLHGDLGRSIIHPDESVMDLIVPRIKISAPIGLTAFFISIFFGTIVGLLAAVKGGWIDSILMLFSIGTISIPVLISLQFLILVLAVYLGFLPTSWSGGWESIFSLNMIIPTIALSLPGMGAIARQVRNYTMPVLNEDFVMVAEASGFSFWHVSLRYILRNSLLPLITVIIPALFSVIMGAFFVEKIYGIQGMGVLMVDVAFQRDFDVLTSFTMITAFLFVIGNLIADIVYTIVDPRISFSKTK